MNDQEIGKRIKHYRKGKMTQQELAMKIGKTESSIRKYEKGLVTIPLNVLEDIASTLGISPFNLMGFDYWDKKYPNKIKGIKEGEVFIDYLEKIGFLLKFTITKPPDEYFVTLSNDQHQVIFTQAEFEELQSAVKEVIAGKFYKKVLEQQENK